MSYNNCLISILIITIYLLNIIPIAFSIQNDTELSHICLPNNKPVTNTYNQSRALVLMDLISNIHSYEGFRNASYTWFKDDSGRELDPKEWSYGLALCRGDVTPDDCKTCVNNASITLVNTQCPDTRSGIIWHDYCLFKYSDVNFFGIIDTSDMYISRSDYSFPMPREFTEAARNLMVRLRKVAVRSPMLYANETFVLTGTQYTLYGMVQCSRDLSKDNCKACLDSAIYKLDITKQGARVVYGSCNVRYETYNFLKS